jgi:hypothetical protein
MKQTAVEFLIVQIHKHWNSEGLSFEKILEQAKAMEKEQIQNAYDTGEYDCGCNGDSEQYYNKTFKKD